MYRKVIDFVYQSCIIAHQLQEFFKKPSPQRETTFLCVAHAEIVFF